MVEKTKFSLSRLVLVLPFLVICIWGKRSFSKDYVSGVAINKNLGECAGFSHEKYESVLTELDDWKVYYPEEKKDKSGFLIRTNVGSCNFTGDFESCCNQLGLKYSYQNIRETNFWRFKEQKAYPNKNFGYVNEEESKKENDKKEKNNKQNSSKQSAITASPIYFDLTESFGPLKKGKSYNFSSQVYTSENLDEQINIEVKFFAMQKREFQFDDGFYRRVDDLRLDEGEDLFFKEWISTLKEDSVFSLRAGEKRNVDFVLDIPQDAPNGGYAVLAVLEASKASSITGSGVAIRNAIGIPVYFVVEKDNLSIKDKVKFEEVSLVCDGKKLKSGDVIKPTKDFFGNKKKDIECEISFFLSNESISFFQPYTILNVVNKNDGKEIESFAFLNIGLADQNHLELISEKKPFLSSKINEILDGDKKSKILEVKLPYYFEPKRIFPKDRVFFAARFKINGNFKTDDISVVLEAKSRFSGEVFSSESIDIHISKNFLNLQVLLIFAIVVVIIVLLLVSFLKRKKHNDGES